MGINPDPTGGTDSLAPIKLQLLKEIAGIKSALNRLESTVKRISTPKPKAKTKAAKAY